MFDHLDALRACTASTPAGINMDGVVSLLLWVIGIGAALVGAKIIFRSDRQSPRHTGNTVLILSASARGSTVPPPPRSLPSSVRAESYDRWLSSMISNRYIASRHDRPRHPRAPQGAGPPRLRAEEAARRAGRRRARASRSARCTRPWPGSSERGAVKAVEADDRRRRRHPDDRVAQRRVAAFRARHRPPGRAAAAPRRCTASPSAVGSASSTCCSTTSRRRPHLRREGGVLPHPLARARLDAVRAAPGRADRPPRRAHAPGADRAAGRPLPPVAPRARHRRPSPTTSPGSTS